VLPAAVLLDGTSLTSVQHSWLHQRIALVSQEPVLFADTIAANIAFGCPGGTASQEQLEEAARVANAHEFVSAFPQVGQGRAGLEGGAVCVCGVRPGACTTQHMIYLAAPCSLPVQHFPHMLPPVRQWCACHKRQLPVPLLAGTY
jgi:hypothetical protein